ncbi:hypothetical protein OYT1_ch2478 [Ferriphaselus amnicola]|uniref:Type IV secretion system putative lipoprotein virB7 n=1 Tax=Ferriphaselus amnicola TaxID=1188319 RepID=A0A2Z6GED7_9PROT|nr:lipoprotein [Ferriphaselus amnicola]BBE51991.1 hypothetical protein OYT1_ch2478 [Ferriphaselus amnicola]
MKKLVAVIGITAFLAGCSTNPNEGVGNIKRLVGLEQGQSSIRDETDDSIKKKIFKGKTTKDEVVKLFGEPGDKSATFSGNFDPMRDNGKPKMENETWTYHMEAGSVFDQVKGLGMATVGAARFNKQHMTTKRLILVFNKQNLLIDFTFDSDILSNSGKI